MFGTIITDTPLPQTVIKALYQYYQQPQNSMTIGETYLLLKLVISKMEDELEKMGFDIEKELAETIVPIMPNNH